MKPLVTCRSRVLEPHRVSDPTLPGKDTITFTQSGKSVSVHFTITGAAPPANKSAPEAQQDTPKPQPAPQPKLAPYASLSPYMGPPGTVVNASGGGWVPNEPVTVTQSGASASGGGGTIMVDANGDIDSNFRIAEGTQPGTLTITFRQGSSSVTVHFEVE